MPYTENGTRLFGAFIVMRFNDCPPDHWGAGWVKVGIRVESVRHFIQFQE
jgi:hypothetical protein